MVDKGYASVEQMDEKGKQTTTVRSERVASAPPRALQVGRTEGTRVKPRSEVLLHGLPRVGYAPRRARHLRVQRLRGHAAPPIAQRALLRVHIVPRHRRVPPRRRARRQRAVVRLNEAHHVDVARGARRRGRLCLLCRAQLARDVHVAVVERAEVYDGARRGGEALAWGVPEELFAPADELPAPAAEVVSWCAGAAVRRVGAVVHREEGSRCGGIFGRHRCHRYRFTLAREQAAHPVHELPAPAVPVRRGVDARLHIRVVLRLPLLLLAAAEAPDDREEDESAAERHEEDLPPLQSAPAIDHGRRVDAGHRRDRRLACSGGGDDEVRETYTESVDDVRGGDAIRSNARSGLQLLGRAGTRKAV